MEDTQQGSNKLFNQEFQEKKSSKGRLFIIVGIIVITLVLSSFFVRAYAKEYYLDKNSDALRITLLNVINMGNSQIRHLKKMNTQNISEIRRELQDNKNYVDNQVTEFETNNKTKILGLDKTVLCDGKTIDYNPSSFHHCNEIRIVKNKGYKEYIASGAAAIKNIVSNSQSIVMTEYNLDILEENKYELEKKLIEVKRELGTKSETTKETKEKIDDIKRNSGAVIAQTLDALSYASKNIVILQTMQGIVGNNEEIWNEKGGFGIMLIKKIDQDMNLPSENQIQKLELQQECISLFKSSNQYSGIERTSTPEKLLFLSSSVSDICENLIKYQKQNAINMLKRSEDEQNPFISIGDKLYLNLVVNCKSEWFSVKEDKPCIENYLNKFETKVSQGLNE